MSRAGQRPVRRRRPRRGGDLQPRARRGHDRRSTTRATAPTAARWPPSPPPRTRPRHRQHGHLQRLDLERSRTARSRKLRVGPRRQRQLRDRHRHDADDDHAATPPSGDRRRRGCGSPTTRAAPTSTRTTLHGQQQPGADRRLQRDAEPGDRRPDGQLQRAPARATPTARSPSTSGTSTATAATRPTPAPPRRPRAPTPRPARSPSACA